MDSRASAYGIGTYVTQLIYSLREAKIPFGLINLYAPVSEITLENKNGYPSISIPLLLSSHPKSTDYYQRNAAYILKELIPAEPNEELIFHLNFTSGNSLVRYLKKLFKCRIVLTLHYANWNFDLLGNEKKLKRVLFEPKNRLTDAEKKTRKEYQDDQKMIRQCHKVVFVARHSLEAFSKYAKIDHAQVINNGVKDAFTALSEEWKKGIRKKYFIDPQARIILFVGRLDEGKGTEPLLKSFKNVLDKHPDALLVVVGDGNFSELLKEAGNCWTRIVFTGRLGTKQLYEFYQIADLGVVCSVHEAFGYVAVEMMMHRVPVIVSDVGGLSEIVEHAVSGLKIPVLTRKGNRMPDTRKLTGAISYLLENRNVAAALGTAGREKYLEKYELSVFRDKIIALYREL